MHAPPTCTECTLTPEQFQITLRRRLRWPLPLEKGKCVCGVPVDPFGGRNAVCVTSGRVKRRAGPVESTVAQICREARARERTDTCLKGLNASVLASDERCVEVIASVFPVHNGA